jgi:hypothetical protein
MLQRELGTLIDIDRSILVTLLNPLEANATAHVKATQMTAAGTSSPSTETRGAAARTAAQAQRERL